MNQEQVLIKWELAQREGLTPPPFRFVTVIRVEGSLDIDRCEHALNVTVDRHSGLQYAIRPVGEVLPGLRDLQLRTFSRTGLFIPGLYQQAPFHIEWIPIKRMHSPDLSDVALQRLLSPAVSQPFDLSTPPYLAMYCVSAGTSNHALVLVLSHLVADAWSLGVIAEDLLDAYRLLPGRLDQSPPSLSRDAHAPELALAEHRARRRGSLDTAIAFWRDRWETQADWWIKRALLSPSSPLPAEVGVGEVRRSIEDHWAARVRLRSRLSRASLYMFFRCAVMLALARLTNAPQVSIAGTSANRTATTARTVGWLNNRHIVSVDLRSNPTAAELLSQTRDDVLSTLAHEVALEAIWMSTGRRLDMGRDRANVTFDFYLHDKRKALEWEHLCFQRPRPLAGPWMLPDLDIRVIDQGSTFDVVIRYDCARHVAQKMVEIAAMIETCAMSLATEPDRCVVQ